LGHTRRPLSTNHYLYPPKLNRCCYPERNFERNQLLGGSMSLSPLYAAVTNDLHVSTAADLHQPFGWLHPRRVEITTFRVYIRRLCRPAPGEPSEANKAEFLRFRCALGLVPVARSLT